MGFLAARKRCLRSWICISTSPRTTGNPWPVTLGQVAFGTLILMLCVLYAFMAKGWLR